MKRLSEDKIQLCGRANKCCPIITKLDDDNYEVLDDYGNKIKVKKEELEMVSDAVKELDKPSNEQLLCG
ncbi:MAG: hypothetical protein ACO3UU_13155 [Minisyncoccia bacterium]